jgi:hypothetical protein
VTNGVRNVFGLKIALCSYGVKPQKWSNRRNNNESLLAKMGAEINEEISANNEKFAVLRGTLFSRMDIHQARAEAIQEEIIAEMDAHQERMEANMNAWREENKACLQKMEANPSGDSERNGAP